MEGSFWGSSEALNLAGRVEVLLHPGELDVAAVITGIFQGHGRLQGKALKEVGLVESERAAAGRRHHQLGHACTIAVVERVGGKLRTGVDLHLAVGEPGAGKSRAFHLQLADHDTQHLHQHFFFEGSRVDLARGLKQSLQARHLLLQVDGFPVSWLSISRELVSGRHASPLSVESHSSMRKPGHAKGLKAAVGGEERWKGSMVRPERFELPT